MEPGTLKLKKLFCDFGLMVPIPEPDDFLVSIGKRGIGTVYHIAKISPSKKKRGRWNLAVYVADDMKDKVQHNPNSGQVWVDGRVAWSIKWYSRNKK
jgi:hypothetical protein